jgi:hypothetical protein
LDEDVNTAVFEMAKEESAAGGDQQTHSVVAQINPQNVIAPEPQPGSSRTVTVPERLPLPRREPESTARISKTDVRKQHSEILTGIPMKKKLEDSDCKKKSEKENSKYQEKSKQENLQEEAER